MKHEKQKPRFFALTKRWQVHTFLDKIRELLEEDKKRIAEEIEDPKQTTECKVLNVIAIGRSVQEYEDLILSIEKYLDTPDNETPD